MLSLRSTRRLTMSQGKDRIRTAAAKVYGASFDASVDREDVEQEAALRIWEAALRGETLAPEAAVDVAANALRAPQVGSGNARGRAVVAYFGQLVETAEGITLGDTIATPDAPEARVDYRERLAGESIPALLAARRIVEGAGAHGETAARRGAAGTVLGAEHDALLAEGIDAIGGLRYGYAPALLDWLAGKGYTMDRNALYQWVSRYQRRVVRENHSSRD
jgi:hypothetical protein